MAIGLIVPAAGRGERLGAGVPKALLPLAGQPLLVHAVRGALSSRVIDMVVVAAPADRVAEVRGLLAGEVTELRVVSGGDARRESVARALAELPPEVDTVLVHDAARCLTPPAVFAAVVAALAGGAAAVVPAVPVADTVKQVAHGVVVGTPDRDTLRAVQTPQGFRRDVLERAHATEPGAVTDDAGLVERLGFQVSVVAGHEEAFKITRSLDLVLAEAILGRRARAGAP
jgi:2-C-methyl-D-erythritol 4-phosphate cytidylyltransferase